MATANMRHFNSPEELAKRESGTAAPARSGQGFRHYNSPAEIAKRTGKPVAPAVAAPLAPPARQVIDVAPEPPPASALALHEQTRSQAGPLTDPPGDPLERLQLLERFVFALLDSPAEAREWRLQMNNIAATVDAQRELANKLRALTGEVDQLVEAANAPGTFVNRLREVEASLERLLAPAVVNAPTQAPAAASAAATPPASTPTT